MTEHHHNLTETPSSDDLKMHDVSLQLREISYLMDVIHKDAMCTDNVNEFMALLDLFERLKKPSGSPLDLMVDRAQEYLDTYENWVGSHGLRTQPEDLGPEARARLEVAKRITNPEWLLEAASYLQGEKEVSE